MAEELVVSGIRLDTQELLAGQRRTERALEQIEQKVKRVDRESSRASSTFGRFGSSIRSLIGPALALGTAFGGMLIIRRVGRFIFDANRQIQRMQAQLKTVTGSAAGASRAFRLIEDFARETPFQISNLTESFIRLRAFGFDPAERELRGLGNVAAAFRGDITELSDAIISAVNGMVRPIRRFGADASVQGNQITVSFQGVTRTMDRTTGAVSEFFAEMGNGGALATAMAERMDTLGGAISNLEDSAFTFARQVGEQGLNRELVRVVRQFDTMIGTSDELAIALGQGAAGGVQAFATIIERSLPLLERFADFLATFRDNAAKLSDTEIGKIVQTDDIAALENVIAGRARFRRQQVEQLQRAQSAIEGVPERRRIGRSGMATVANPEFVRLNDQIRNARSAIEATDRIIAAAARRVRELQSEAIGTPEFRPVERGTEQLSDFQKAIEELTEGRRGIRALEEALRGTSVEFDASRERVALLSSVIDRLSKIDTPEAREALQSLVPELSDLSREAQIAEQRLAGLEAQERFRQRAEERFRQSRADNRRALASGQLDQVLERQRTIERFGDRFADSMTRAIFSTQSFAAAFSEMTRQILADLASLAIRQQAIGFLSNLFGLGGNFEGGVDLGGPGGGLPNFAIGGSVSRGEAAIVGERGPELFVPSSAGRIVPNDQLSGRSGNSLSFTVQIQGVVDRSAANAVARKARGEILKAVRDARDSGLL